MDRALDFWIKLAEAVLDEVGPYIDVVQFGDAVAFQDRPMVNPKLYREIVKPRHRKMVDTFKKPDS